jgi:hypothetical protein
VLIEEAEVEVEEADEPDLVVDLVIGPSQSTGRH